MQRGRMLVSLLLVAAMLSGCTPQPLELGDGPVTEQTVDRLSAALERGGVAVIDEPDPDSDAFGEHHVVVTRDQVGAMAGQLLTGAGISGPALDAAGPLGEELPPLSYLLAGWALEHDGKGADVVREFVTVDRENPAAVVWPDVALALFLADVTADVAIEIDDAAGQHRTAVALAGFAPDVASGTRTGIGELCEAAAGFVQKAIAWVYNAIESAARAAEKGAGGFLGAIIGYGIRLLNHVVTGALELVSKFTAAVLAPLKDALAIVEIVQTISSALKPWSVRMTADPVALVQTSAAQPGTVRATVETQGLGDFPDWVRKCAAAIGVTLPPKPGAGTLVDWQLLGFDPDLAAVNSADPVVQKDGTVQVSYTLFGDPAADDGIPLTYFALSASLTPHRDQIDQLWRLVNTLLGDQLAVIPPPLGPVVKEFVLPLLLKAEARVKAYLTPAATSSIVIPVTRWLPKAEAKAKPLPGVPSHQAFCTAWVQHWSTAGTVPADDINATERDFVVRLLDSGHVPAELVGVHEQLIADWSSNDALAEEEASRLATITDPFEIAAVSSEYLHRIGLIMEDVLEQQKQVTLWGAEHCPGESGAWFQQAATVYG